MKMSKAGGSGNGAKGGSGGVAKGGSSGGNGGGGSGAKSGGAPVGNLPSRTGQPSGGGRGNAPPSK